MNEKALNLTILKLIRKKAIDLESVIVDKIVVSDKFKHSEDGYKYYIGYQEDEIVRPLCIILPQMNRHKIF